MCLPIQTVQHQLKKLERREREKTGEEGKEEFCMAAHEERVIQRNLAKTEGVIAGLIEDFKFECESELLAHR